MDFNKISLKNIDLTGNWIWIASLTVIYFNSNHYTRMNIFFYDFNEETLVMVFNLPKALFSLVHKCP